MPLCFEHGDVVASLGELMGGRQPRQARPDDDDSLGWPGTNGILRQA
jgi:hypothetical protein